MILQKNVRLLILVASFVGALACEDRTEPSAAFGQQTSAAALSLGPTAAPNSYGYRCYPYRVWDYYEIEDGAGAMALNEQSDAVVYSGNPSGSRTVPFMGVIHYAAERIHRFFDCELRDDNTGGTFPFDINDSGEVVGRAWNRDTETQFAFYWKEVGTLLQPVFTETDESVALAINNSSAVVGYYQHPFSFTMIDTEFVWWENAQAFIWNPGDATALLIDPLPEAWEHAASKAHTINDSGTFAGETEIAPHETIPIVWRANDDYTLLPTLGGIEGRVLDLNNFGDAVGQSEDAAGELIPTLWQGDVAYSLGLLTGPAPYDSGQATAINDAGVIVGWEDAPDLQHHSRAWIYEDGFKTDLNELISPKVGLTIIEATDINEAGEIAAIAILNSQPLQQRGIKLIPQSCEAFGGDS